jgi:hypothetical protein
MKDIRKNHIAIQGWMVQDLNLSGNELITFALIYGFCQDRESKFTGAINYVCNWLNCTRPTASKALRGLTEKNLIIKTTIVNNGVTFNNYNVNFEKIEEKNVVKNLYGGSKESLQGGSKESLPNNIYYNNINKESIHQNDEIGIYNYKTNFEHIGLGYESNVKIPKKYQDVNLREYISKNRDVEGLSEDHFIKMISKEYYFNVFWEKYPKKAGKKTAKDAFMKLDLTTSKLASEKVEYYALSRENEDPKFTKHASTYLNQESYNDEFVLKRLVLPEDYMFRDLNAEQKKILSPEKLKSYENHRARGEAEGYYFKPAKMIYEEVKIN